MAATPPVVSKIGARTTIALGFIIMTAGFVILAFVQDSWKYSAFVLPLIAIAAGMSLRNGPRELRYAAVAASTSHTLRQ